MKQKFNKYHKASDPIPSHQYLWPLYGAGFENLGKNGQLIKVPVPQPSADELLVRHDAVGLCFSDIKVISLGQSHPRIYKNMQTDPVILGHEVAMTVVKVGENLKTHYKPGDRFIIQADIFINGVGYAYGYELQGGLSQYTIIDRRVLNGDAGSYLLPVQSSTGYAESALTEPWACVTASYSVQHRTSIKAGGTLWIVGTEDVTDRGYHFSQGMDESIHPARILLSRVPQTFSDWIRQRTTDLGISVDEILDPTQPSVELVDDIVILGSDHDLVELVSPHLAVNGVLALVTEKPFERKVQMDVGRIHYNYWTVVGGTSTDISQAYVSVPIRQGLKSGGRTWFLGAGGPMGQMHVQRALQSLDHPGSILCTDLSDMRLQDLDKNFSEEACTKGIDWLCLNPGKSEAYQEQLHQFQKGGFDDIVVLVPVPAIISEAADHLAPGGVMNIFAGVNRGVMASLDLNRIVFEGLRYTGQSGSSIEDLRSMLHQAEAGTLSPNRSVAAIGSLSTAKEGLMALKNATYPGKVVIFPQIKNFPLTSLPELEEKLPTVYAKLKDKREWTVEAEQEFLQLMLPGKDE